VRTSPKALLPREVSGCSVTLAMGCALRRNIRACGASLAFAVPPCGRPSFCQNRLPCSRVGGTGSLIENIWRRWMRVLTLRVVIGLVAVVLGLAIAQGMRTPAVRQMIQSSAGPTQTLA